MNDGSHGQLVFNPAGGRTWAGQQGLADWSVEFLLGLQAGGISPEA